MVRNTPWFYISYSGDDGSIHAAFLTAEDAHAAANEFERLHGNAQGEMLVLPLETDDELPEERWRWRVLNYSQLAECFETLGGIMPATTLNGVLTLHDGKVN